jgi:hypothetical protein
MSSLAGWLAGWLTGRAYNWILKVVLIRTKKQASSAAAFEILSKTSSIGFIASIAAAASA